MKTIHKIFSVIFIIALFFISQSYLLAQEKPISEMTKEELLELSYEELLALPFEDFIQIANKFELSADELLELFLNKDVSIASKKEESSFDSPLSTSVISKKTIEQSGATTIEELFRLVPGMIVRTKTNGNYDVHIRGNDNVPPGNFNHFSKNTLTLVMIDHRIVYNYINGGTFWESLPIGLNDIEQIEIIRGASSALYGPNAVSGVINIITKKPDGNKFKTGVDVQAPVDFSENLLANAYVRKGFNKLKLKLSANYEYRSRFQDSYYCYALGDYVAENDVISLFGYPYFDDKLSGGKLAKDRKGINAILYYDWSDDIQINLSGGYQDSDVQTIFFENLAIPFGNRTTESYYTDFKLKLYGFDGQFSVSGGDQNLSKNMIKPVIHYDFNTLNANLGYSLSLNNLTIRPGILFQKAIYNDKPHVEAEQKTRPEVEGLLNGSRDFTSMSYSLRADYLAFKKLRLIAAVNADKYNKPDDWYASYQFIGSYKFNDNHLLRAVYSRSNRGSFIGDVNANFKNPLGPQPDQTTMIPVENPPGSGNYVNVPFTVKIDQYYQYYVGNENIDLLTMDMLEFGIRNKITKHLQTDFEFFYTKTRDFDVLVEPDAVFQQMTAMDPVNQTINMIVHDSLVYQNIDIKTKQFGVSGNIKLYVNQKIQVELFGTLQKTDLEDFYDAQLDSLIKIEHNWTPTFYGGAICNYAPHEKWNINMNIYGFTKQTYRRYKSPLNWPNERATDEINAKAIFNLKVNFKFWKENSVFFNARNLLNTPDREFGFADKSKGLYLLGLSIQL